MLIKHADLARAPQLADFARGRANQLLADGCQRHAMLLRLIKEVGDEIELSGQRRLPEALGERPVVCGFEQVLELAWRFTATVSEVRRQLCQPAAALKFDDVIQLELAVTADRFATRQRTGVRPPLDG